MGSGLLANVRSAALSGMLLTGMVGGAAVAAQDATPDAFSVADLAPGVVPTEYGDVTVPENPERVVVFGDIPLDSAVAVGVVPVGATSTRGSDQVAAYVADEVPGIAIAGAVSEPNLEAVVALEPDLILTSWADEETWKTLSQIAPTIVPLTVPFDGPEGLQFWEYEALIYGHALGKSAEMEQALADVEARVAEVAEAVGEPAGETAAVVRWMEQGPVVMSEQLIGPVMLARLGLNPPAIAQGFDGGHTDVLSLENLSEVDTDWLFIATFNEDGAAAYEAVSAEPAFQQLRAAEAGKVAVVNGSLWSSAAGPIAAQRILDDIEAAFAQAGE